jgi:hypothetical protein
MCDSTPIGNAIIRGRNFFPQKNAKIIVPKFIYENAGEQPSMQMACTRVRDLESEEHLGKPNILIL